MSTDNKDADKNKKKTYSIFTNTNVFTFSDPQPTWLFHVFFYTDAYTDATGTLLDYKHLIAESVTLPSYETELVTKKFFGSERSYPVLRTYGTDVEMTFTLRTAFNDNKELYRISQINARHLRDQADHKDGRNYNRSILYPTHPELEHYSDKTSGTWWYKTINKIVVRMKDKTGATAKTSLRNYELMAKSKNKPFEENASTSLFTTEYTFHNCVLKSFSFDSGLDYSSEDILKCKLVYHSDIWTVANLDTTNIKGSVKSNS